MIGRLMIPDRSGHTVVKWDTETGFDFEQAEAQFKALTAIPSTFAVASEPGSGKGEVITKLHKHETREVRIHRAFVGG